MVGDLGSDHLRRTGIQRPYIIETVHSYTLPM